MNGSMLRTLGFLVAIGLLPASAEDPVPGVGKPSIAELVKRLGDSDFAARQAAQRELGTAGAEAVPELIKAAASGDAEAKQRALSVLKELASASEEATVAALDGIVESGPAADAEIATSLLKLVVNTKSGEIPADEMTIPGVEIEYLGDSIRFRMGGGGAIQINSKGGGLSRMNLKTGNGIALTVGSTGGKQAVIAIDPEGAIRMKVTAEEEGERVTRAFQYRNREEFKELNPDLFALFERFKHGR